MAAKIPDHRVQFRVVPVRLCDGRLQIIGINGQWLSGIRPIDKDAPAPGCIS
jgi:hypothetical protein